uniref:Uncharacterized protein n=1 Tax=Octopus bimaculoides TaxID=37653 RepID=A0A0L8H970_OCTBM
MMIVLIEDQKKNNLINMTKKTILAFFFFFFNCNKKFQQEGFVFVCLFFMCVNLQSSFQIVIFVSNNGYSL